MYVDWVEYDRSHDQAESFDYHNKKFCINSITKARLRHFVIDFIAPMISILDQSQGRLASFSYYPLGFKLTLVVNCDDETTIEDVIHGEVNCTEMINLIKQSSWPILLDKLKQQDDDGYMNTQVSSSSFFNPSQTGMGVVSDDVTQADSNRVLDF